MAPRKKAKLLINIDFGNENGTLSCSSMEEIESWINEEKKFWAFLSRGPTFHLKGQYNNSFSNITQTFNSWRENEEDENLKVQFTTALTNTYAGGRPSVLRSITEKAKLISGINQQFGHEAAYAALSLEHKLKIEGNITSEHIVGLTYYFLNSLGVNPETNSALKDSFNQLFSEISNKKSEFERDSKNLKNELEETKVNYIKQFETALSTFDKKFKETHAKQLEDVQNAIGDIKRVEESYKKHMQLAAPAKYWEDKKSGHETKADSRRKILIWYVSVAGLVLLVGGVILVGKLSGVPDFQISELLYVTLAVILTTIVFWVGRILVRLFLSELHLALDAGERNIMITTYLALIAERGVSEKEKEIILTSIFRPTEDGIVKDDGAPGLGLASFLSGQFSKR